VPEQARASIGAPGGHHAGEPDDYKGERLQKLLAAAGFGSRRSCERLVAEGRVSVNGQLARVGQRARPGLDRVTVDGAGLPAPERFAYYLVNKPVGVICSAPGRGATNSVVELVPASPKVFPVGRLDVATEGLIVLTNDGELAYRLAHPKFGVDKEYVVTVAGELSREAVNRLRRGVELEDGLTAPARVSLLGPRALRIVLHEGRNRQVRRMCEAIGHQVVSLARTRVGPLTTKGLAPGQWRQLSAGELRSLWEAIAVGRGSGDVAARGSRRG
jgi:23S rRNA pseudouridine2605 synthase